MSNISISLADQLDEEITRLMRIEGYTSRSEFIRFTVKFYKYHANRDAPPRETQDSIKRGEATKVRKYLETVGDDW